MKKSLIVLSGLAALAMPLLGGCGDEDRDEYRDRDRDRDWDRDRR